ncbi:MAG: hypothetical protein WAT12_13945 [Candidatus Nitrotoga sp.]
MPNKKQSTAATQLAGTLGSLQTTSGEALRRKAEAALDGRAGEIRIELPPMAGDSQCKLRVCDTGVGLPDDFEFKKRHSIGMQLVSDLAKQLKGFLEIKPGATAMFAVNFMPATKSLP